MGYNLFLSSFLLPSTWFLKPDQFKLVSILSICSIILGVLHKLFQAYLVLFKSQFQKKTFLQEALVPFSGEWCLETQTWGLDVLIFIKVSLLPGPLFVSGNREYMFVCMYYIYCQAPLSMEFSRQEYWSGLPFPSLGDLPNPRIKPRSPALQVDSLLTEPPGEPYICTHLYLYLSHYISIYKLRTVS